MMFPSVVMLLNKRLKWCYIYLPAVLHWGRHYKLIALSANLNCKFLITVSLITMQMPPILHCMAPYINLFTYSCVSSLLKICRFILLISTLVCGNYVVMTLSCFMVFLYHFVRTIIDITNRFLNAIRTIRLLLRWRYESLKIRVEFFVLVVFPYWCCPEGLFLCKNKQLLKYILQVDRYAYFFNVRIIIFRNTVSSSLTSFLFNLL